MDERPGRKHLSLLDRLKLWRSRESEEELAENILTGAVPWSGPPSGNTSQASILNVKERLGESGSSTSGTSREESGTRIEDRIVNPDHVPSGEVNGVELDERKSSKCLIHRKTSGNRSDHRRQNPGERFRGPLKSDSRYRIPRGQEKTVWRLDQGGCHKCGCAHTGNRGLKNGDTSWAAERLSKLWNSQSEQVPGDKSPRNLDWRLNRSSWSQNSRKLSDSSWNPLRRGTSLNSLSRLQRDSNSFLGRASELNPFKSGHKLRKSDLEGDDEDDDDGETSKAAKVLQEMERKLSLCHQKTWSALSEKAMSAKQRLAPSLTKCQRIFIDVFLIVLVLMIFVGWFSSRWNSYLHVTTIVHTPPPSLATCYSCGQTDQASPVCSSCPDSFSPFQSIGEHIKIFTDAFSKKYRK